MLGDSSFFLNISDPFSHNENNNASSNSHLKDFLSLHFGSFMGKKGAGLTSKFTEIFSNVYNEFIINTNLPYIYEEIGTGIQIPNGKTIHIELHTYTVEIRNHPYKISMGYSEVSHQVPVYYMNFIPDISLMKIGAKLGNMLLPPNHLIIGPSDSEYIVLLRSFDVRRYYIFRTPEELEYLILFPLYGENYIYVVRKDMIPQNAEGNFDLSLFGKEPDDDENDDMPGMTIEEFQKWSDEIIKETQKEN